MEYQGEEELSGSQEHLSRAVRLIEHAEEFNPNLALHQALTQLGQWIHDQPPVDEWTADPMTSSLPEAYLKYVQPQRLTHLGFEGHDFFVLREAIWASNIARWQVAQKDARQRRLEEQVDRLESDISALARRSDSEAQASGQLEQMQQELAQKLAELHPPWLAELREKDQKSLDQLTTALRLFDWTVRNVRLQPTYWDAKLPSPDAAGDVEVSTDDSAGRHLPPGAETPAWQALLWGRGDALTRARIFLLLARQQNIEVIMLGLKRGNSEEPRTWAAAALIGDQLYLFEPELGLPFAGPGGRGVCTLAQLRSDPSLLRQFDVDGLPYHVQSDHLKDLVAMIDATPAYLSQRMLLVERSLPSDQRLVLSVAPSRLARALRKHSLPETAIWTAPYRQFEFEQLRMKNPELAQRYAQPASAYDSPLPLVKARMLHFRGQLDSQQDGPYGAKHFYMECRPPDREIDVVEKVPAVKEQLKKLEPEARDAFVANMKDTVRRAKAEATFWLGVVAAEQGEGGVAIDYLDLRTLRADLDGRWSDAARYNLGRIYEDAGRFDKAIEFYQASRSPQRHGDLVRAKRLELAKASDSE